MQIEPHQRAWLKLTRPLGLVENTALIATPNEFVKEQLETRLRALITHALSRELGRSIQLAVTVDPTAITAATAFPPAPADPGPAAGPAAGQDGHGGMPGTLGGPVNGPMSGRIPRAADPLDDSSRLGGAGLGGPGLPGTAEPGNGTAGGHPGLTGHPGLAPPPGQAAGYPAGQPGEASGPFDALAAAAACARAAAAWRAPAYPGPAQPQVHVRDLRDRLEQPVRPRRRGRGRRGARQGLQPALRLRRLGPGQDPPAARDRPLRAEPLPRGEGPVRVELEEFTNEFINAIRDDKQDGFRRRYRDVDVLLVDDIQFLESKEADPGGVLPHLQHAAQRQQADRDLLRPGRPSAWSRWKTGCAAGSSGA